MANGTKPDHAAKHEAAHAVASYWYQIPGVLIQMGGAAGHAGEWHADDDAIWVAVSYLVHNGKSWTKLVQNLAVACHAAEAVDIHINKQTPEMAAAHSAGDKKVLESVVAFLEDLHLKHDNTAATRDNFKNLRELVGKCFAKVVVKARPRHSVITFLHENRMQ